MTFLHFLELQTEQILISKNRVDFSIYYTLTYVTSGDL